MLCDEIVRDGITGSSLFPSDGLDRIIDRIKGAVKFNLTPEFSQIADALATDYTQISKALEFCRLPYPEIWIEFPQSGRPHFNEGDNPKAWQARPERVGFLLKATRPDMSAFKAHMFWTLRSPVTNQLERCVSFLAIQFDMTNRDKDRASQEEVTSNAPHHSMWWLKAKIEDRKRLINVVQACEPDYFSPLFHSNVDRATSITLWTMANQDWAGETQFLESMLALLNCRNVHQTEYVDHTQFNKKRASRGKPPLLSYHIVKIHAHHIQRATGNSQSTDHRALRQHFVIGHFKNRRTGLFFWRPFTRGDRSRGRVMKDYEMEV
jgi:hypothetical protein